MNSESTFALDAKDCWECLRSTSIGRLAVIVDDWPEIFPVNYAIEHSALVIRTGEGTKVDAIRAHPRVAFEIDGVDTEDGTAFSVVVKGNAKEINAPEDLQETLSLDVAPLQSGTKNHFIRILAEEVTGRHFPVTDPSDWETDLSHVARAPREQSGGPRASSRADPARAVGQVSREWLGRHREWPAGLEDRPLNRGS